jgi:hypothetical protein
VVFGGTTLAGSYEGERDMARGGIEPPTRGFSVLLFYK